MLHSHDQVPRGHRVPLGQFRILNNFSGVAESLLSSHDKPWCWSCKYQPHNALVLPPASTYRCKCPVTFVHTNCPLIPISTSGSCRRHSLSAHLDSSHRGLLPVSHVFVDSSRLLCFLIAPPGRHCVRLLVYLLAFHDSAAVPSALNQPTSQLTVLSMPSLVACCITYIAFGSLHVLLARLTISPCTFLCADNQLIHLSKCCFAPLGCFLVCNPAPRLIVLLMRSLDCHAFSEMSCSSLDLQIQVRLIVTTRSSPQQ